MNYRSKDRKIHLGKIGKPQGLKGGVFFHYFGKDISDLLLYKELFIEDNSQKKFITINQSRSSQNKFVVHVEGFNDRNAAEKLRGKDIFINSIDLPEPSEGSFYLYQLEGFDVINLESELLGTMDSFIQTNANDVMVVKYSEFSIDKRERLIPFLIKENLIEVDIDEGTIKVDWKSFF